MAFQYYQNNTAGWGSNQFQFGPPPAYGFQPQQHWRAYDFYSAHAPRPQTEIFQYAMNRLSSSAGPLGVGMHEARHWHRRAYGGIGDITRMLPSEIGHAAAYEAYRSWIHRSPTFQILDGDLERQKEALISLAIAEAAQLWEATGRGYDQYALQIASETAAATASLIFSQTLDHQMLGNDYYRARNATYPNAGDAYAMDDMALMQRQQMGGGAMGGGMMGGPGGMMGTGTLGGLPRPASAGPIPAPGMRGSPYMGASPMVGGSPYMGAAPMAGGSPYAVGGGAAPAAGVGGFVQPGAGAGAGQAGMAGMAGGVQYGSSIASTYPGIENARPTTYGASGYGSNVVPGPPGGTFGGGALGTGGYGAGAGGYGAGAGTYGAGGYGAGGYGAGGYGAGSYGAGGYGGGYGAGGYGAQPQQPVVLVERRRSRHDHGHHHRRHHSVPRTGYY